jgi:hypothetical protein
LLNGFTSYSDYVPVNGLVAFRLKYLINPTSTSVTQSFEFETYDGTYMIESVIVGVTV